MLPKTSPNWSLKIDALHARRQVAPDVVHLVAHLDPDLRHPARGRVVLEIDEDRGLARGRVALGVVERVELLQLALDAVGDLVGHLHDRGAGPARIDHHALDGEGGILLAAEPRVGQAARHHDQQHQVPDEGAVLQRPGREVEAVHCGTLTDWPAVRLCTPAMTMRSPAAMPEVTTMRSPSREPTVTSRCDTVLLGRIDHPDEGSCRPSRAAPSPAGRHAPPPAG